MSDLRDTFIEECEDLLEQLSDGLIVFQTGTPDSETINAVFRAVHSIKGGAGAFGLDDLVSFSHKVENVLDMLRDGDIELSPPLVDVLLRSSDQLALMVEAFRDDAESDTAQIDELVGELGSFLGADGADEPEEDIDFGFQPVALAPIPGLEALNSDEETYSIKFAPNETLLKNGHEPLFLFQELSEMGELVVTLDSQRLPALKDIDPLETYLSWDLILTTSASLADIRSVFDFVEILCTLDIAIVEPEEEEPVLSQDPALVMDDPKPVATEIPVVPLLAPTTKPDAPAKAKPPAATLRVELDRVDRLVNTIGELIINQAMLSQAISEIEAGNHRDIDDQLEGYRLLARDLQEDAMAIRAQPVKPLFQRMGRIVREAASSTSKAAKMETLGESCEVDKTLIERLADPLTHMVRNAVDHGLETPEDRIAAGKPKTGIITLSATHRSGSVLIEVSDDGAGLNREKIKQIAINKGLIPDTADLTDSDIDNLLFLPGFSTNSEVSSLSGRGVGMDVVKTAVSALGGRVTISSTPGVGTCFSVIVPLTLAVMDGMVVQIGRQKMVIPIACVHETLVPGDGDLFFLGQDGPFFRVRDVPIPVIDLCDTFDNGHRDSNESQTLLLVETQANGNCAFSVDAILDQRQIVIKSLDGVDAVTPGIAAATILGNGEIAMILDPDGIVETWCGTVKKPHSNIGDLAHAATG